MEKHLQQVDVWASSLETKLESQGEDAVILRTTDLANVQEGPS